MVGPLTALKMLHCKNISRCNRDKPIFVCTKKQRKASTMGHSSRSESITSNRVIIDVKMEPLNDLCRVCLGEGSLRIFGEETIDLADAITTFGAIEVAIDDSHPKHLCLSCHALLQGAILFRKTAQQTYEILKHQASEINKQQSDEVDKQKEYEILIKPQEAEPEEDTFDYLSNEEVEYSNLEKSNKIAPKVLSCTRCQLEFNSFVEYQDHRLSDEHENKKHCCPICNNLYSPEYMNRHMSLHKAEPLYVCDICGKTFTIQTHFTRHHLTHFYSLPFQCSLCPYKGRFSESLKMHMRSHTGEKPYQCSQCPSRFISKSNLNRHLLTHKGVRDYKCEVCGREFYTKRNLEMHFNVDHAGIKEHVCTICNKAFGYRKQMMKHMLKVHKRQKLRSGRTPIYIKVEHMKQQKDVVESES